MKEILDKQDVSLKMDSKPSVILVIGVNGVGKTTSIGKIANRLKKESEVNKQISIFDDFDNLEKDQKIKTITMKKKTESEQDILKQQTNKKLILRTLFK